VTTAGFRASRHERRQSADGEREEHADHPVTRSHGRLSPRDRE
jgi:hypothetical protein